MSGRQSGKTQREAGGTRREAGGTRREAGEAQREPGEAGVLTLAAAPIGRADDASARLVAALGEATLIAAEDTRRVRWLASHLNVELKARVVSYYDAVETRRTPACSETCRRGRTSCSSPTRVPRRSAIRATGSSPPRPRPACG